MPIGKTIENMLKEEKKVAEGVIKKAKEDLTLKNLLKSAKDYEAKGDYKKALDRYLKFLELKLHIIKERPELTLDIYLSLTPYYIKVAECYENSRHLKKEDMISDLENAARYYIKSAQMYIEVKKYNLAHHYFEIASHCYEKIDEFKKSAECYIKIADMYLKLRDKVLAASSYIKAAEFYEKADDYGNASKIYLKIAELNLEFRNKLAASSSYKKAADSFMGLGDNSTAIRYYMKAAELSLELEHYSNASESYESIALCYEQIKDYRSAIQYHLKSAELSINENPTYASLSYENIAKSYERLGDFNSAIEYCKKSIDLRLTLNRYLDLASSYEIMARCYTALNDYKNAADSYFHYAEYGLLGNGGEIFSEGYKNAAEIYTKIAERSLREKDMDNAIENYKNAAESYERLRDYKKSADLYLRCADVESERNYDDAIIAYTEAAERYKKSGDMKSTAECYVKARDYTNAVRFYIKYADTQVKEKDFFNAGTGYMKSAMCYGKLRDKRDKEYYNRAIAQYLRYIEIAETLETEDKNIGNAYWNIAACYYYIGDMEKSRKYLKDALDYYQKKRLMRLVNPVNALISEIDARAAIKVGEYEKAGKLLDQSIYLLDTAVKEFKDEEMREFLEEHKKEAEKLLEKIGKKPELILNINQPEETLSKGIIKLTGRVSNKSGQPVKKISFLPNLPQGFQIVKGPGVIESLDPGKSVDISLEIKAISGSFRFFPLEIIYSDKEKNRYIKASNEIKINIR